jgi:hypothetical protein
MSKYWQTLDDEVMLLGKIHPDPSLRKIGVSGNFPRRDLSYNGRENLFGRDRPRNRRDVLTWVECLLESNLVDRLWGENMDPSWIGEQSTDNLINLLILFSRQGPSLASWRETKIWGTSHIAKGPDARPAAAFRTTTDHISTGRRELEPSPNKSRTKRHITLDAARSETPNV